MSDFYTLIDLLAAEYERLKSENNALRRDAPAEGGVALTRTLSNRSESSPRDRSSSGSWRRTSLPTSKPPRSTRSSERLDTNSSAKEAIQRVLCFDFSDDVSRDRDREWEIAQENWALSTQRRNLQLTTGGTKLAVNASCASLAHSNVRLSDNSLVEPSDVTLIMEQDVLRTTSTKTMSTTESADTASFSAGYALSTDHAADSATTGGKISKTERPSAVSSIHDGLESEETNSELDSCSSSGKRKGKWLDRIVFSPISKRRLAWEVMWVFAFLVEVWIATFELAFLEPKIVTPLPLQILGTIAASFFFFDISINFCTGYVDGDSTVMDRSLIVRRYLRFWFWIDLVAALPLDVILMNLTSAVVLARLARILKGFKALRYMRIIKISDVIMINLKASSVDSEDSFVRRAIQMLVMPLPYLFLLLVTAHVHGCIRASLDGVHRLDSNMSEAIREYYANVWLAYLELAAASFTTGNGIAGNPGLWTYEIFVASERLVLFALVAYWAATRQDQAQMAIVKEGALRFLKRHEVSTATQLQLLQSLRETRDVKLMQTQFKLLSSELPESLSRKISREMWEGRLVSLGLIMRVSKWTAEFVAELVLRVSEEILAPRTVLYHEEEFSTAAYHIIQGVLFEGNTTRESLSSVESEQVHMYSAGMWVGEMALVNSDLRRGSTMIAQKLTRLMVVPSNDFGHLLSKFTLDAKFAQLCEHHLFRGICGRCGAFGEHMPHECPTLRHAPQGKTHWAQITRTSMHAGKVIKDGLQQLPKDGFNIKQLNEVFRPDAAPDKQMGRGLKEFIQYHQLHRLVPSFERLDIWKIEDLIGMATDLTPLVEDLAKHGEAGGLNSAEEMALSVHCVKRFRKKLAENVKRNLLNTGLRKQHLIFLSHYKVEAGTEAALMREELDRLIFEGCDPTHLGRFFDSPTFLDSEDLQDLSNLMERVRNSHSVALLLTQGVLTRPWCLVEVVTAIKNEVPVIPVEVIKPGSQFVFPDDAFYEGLVRGDVLRAEDVATMQACEVTLANVEQALREVFKVISVPYSPHRPAEIRRVELQSLLQRCDIAELLQGSLHTETGKYPYFKNDSKNANGNIVRADPSESNFGFATSTIQRNKSRIMSANRSALQNIQQQRSSFDLLQAKDSSPWF